MRKSSSVIVLVILFASILFGGVVYKACASNKGDQECLQRGLMTGERTVYLFDPVAGNCLYAWRATGGFSPQVNWSIPCADVPEDKLVTMSSDQRRIYLFDPVFSVCLVGYGYREEKRVYLPVACTPAVIDKLEPSAREMAIAAALKAVKQ